MKFGSNISVQGIVSRLWHIFRVFPSSASSMGESFLKVVLLFSWVVSGNDRRGVARCLRPLAVMVTVVTDRKLLQGGSAGVTVIVTGKRSRAICCCYQDQAQRAALITRIKIKRVKLTKTLVRGLSLNHNLRLLYVSSD